MSAQMSLSGGRPLKATPLRVRIRPWVIRRLQALPRDSTARSSVSARRSVFKLLPMRTATPALQTAALALSSNTTGNSNTAVGLSALLSNTTGGSNTAVGNTALADNIDGEANTALGSGALNGNTTGVTNTATGNAALFNNISGNNNVAVGSAALLSNTSGDDNIALGVLAGDNVTTADNVICIGNLVAGENVSNSCYIGNIVGSTVANSNFVLIDTATGQLGTNPSSERFKKDIGPMGKTSEAIFSLKPVSFYYKDDKTSTPQFGLVAEEVAKVNSALITVDEEGKPYSVRYDKVDAMLLNEFLKEHRKVQEQQSEIDALKAELREQRDLIQKVSDRVEMNKSASQIVADNQ